METTFIEAVSYTDAGHPLNHGKFMVGTFTPQEWARRSTVNTGAGLQSYIDSDDEWLAEMAEGKLLASCGWGHEHFVVFDLATGEGGIFRHGGKAQSDLSKHKVWVCPLFEPFLTWLYAQDDVSDLPERVDLTGIPLQMQGYRRSGGEDTLGG